MLRRGCSQAGIAHIPRLHQRALALTAPCGNRRGRWPCIKGYNRETLEQRSWSRPVCRGKGQRPPWRVSLDPQRRPPLMYAGLNNAVRGSARGIALHRDNLTAMRAIHARSEHTGDWAPSHELIPPGDRPPCLPCSRCTPAIPCVRLCSSVSVLLTYAAAARVCERIGVSVSARCVWICLRVCMCVRVCVGMYMSVCLYRCKYVRMYGGI